jgi:hypothetical protein
VRRDCERRIREPRFVIRDLVHGVEWKHNLPFKDDKDENRSIFATGRITVVVLNIFLVHFKATLIVADAAIFAARTDMLL